MRGIRSGLSAVVAIGLVATLAVGVTAQEEADDTVAAAPVVVTGTSAVGGCPDAGTTEDMGLFERTVGGTCLPTWRFSDERLNGTARLVANEDDYTDESGISVGTFALSIENDEGSWRMRPGFWLDLPDAPEVAAEVWVMDGGGAYEGLTAVLLVEDWTPHGLILEGEMLPAPDNASTK